MRKINIDRNKRRQPAKSILLSAFIFASASAFCQTAGAEESGTASSASSNKPEPTTYQSGTLAVKSQRSLPVISTQSRVEQCENTSFHVHAMLSGSICEDHAIIGRYYRKGELLALMQSPELVRQTADYLSRREQLEMSIKRRESTGRMAKSDLERIRQLVKEGISAEKDLKQAEEEVRSVNEDLEDLNEQRIRLENECQTLATMYGIKSLNSKQETAPSKLPLRAPNSGVLITKNVSLGDRVNPDEPAYVLAGISDLDLKIVLPIAERRSVDIGQQVSFSCRQIPKKTFAGSINRIVFSNDPSSQEFSVGVTLKNPQALLRPGMIGPARISAR